MEEKQPAEYELYHTSWGITSKIYEYEISDPIIQNLQIEYHVI